MDMMDNMNTQELVSALADGQLHGEAFARGVQAAATDPAGREAWQTYHLIGDVLRSGELARGSAPAAFLGRLQVRLREEQNAPLQLDPSVSQTRPAPGFPAEPAANDGLFRWKLLAGVASLAAVAAVAWSVGGAARAPDGPAMAAAQPRSQPVVVQAATPGQVMIRDPRLDEFLAAHRQFGGASALQTPAGFLRNATFEMPSR